MNEYLNWNLLAAAGSLVGGALVVWGRNRHASIGRSTFSLICAGLLVAVALAGMLPHALSESVPLTLAGTITGLMLAWMTRRRGQTQTEKKRSGAVTWTAIVGLGLHSVFEGMAVGSGHHLGAMTGLAAAVGLFVHKLPEGAVAATLTATKGRWVTLAASAVPGVGVVLGSLLAGAFVLSPEWHERGSPFVLGLAAGILLRVFHAEWASTADRPFSFRMIRLFLGTVIGVFLVMLGIWVADGHTASGSRSFHSDGGHQHHAVTPVQVPENVPAPEVHLEVIPEPGGHCLIVLHTRHFRFVPEQPGREPLFGEGHAHLYVDGKKIARLFDTTARIRLEPGTHVIRAELVDSAHAPYVHRGKTIQSEQTVTVK
ncbi:ZIP family metal transporter [Staphylospora marina]|uniref:ZIP family metal transporter n=1 Tax=Staphylospora marina TaxID=2490858 RepID=UPI0013DDCA43|nr:ZIP family metal transporter [Staphylospora marina]